jgi:hypothetical protein
MAGGLWVVCRGAQGYDGVVGVRVCFGGGPMLASEGHKPILFSKLSGLPPC